MWKKHRRLGTALMITATLVILMAGGALVYAADYYPASADALAALASTDAVTVETTGDGVVFLPDEPLAGLIFYPGGKVEHTAYAPLMRALAEEGVLCVLTEMPLRLAVLDMNAADGIAEKYPQVTRWGIGGHSLGGAMAASYAAAHGEELDALILLAAYATRPLPQDMAVVSLTGTADTVLNWDKYDQNRANLPAAAQEISIPGGNHAQFGAYGPQKGDGAASITAEAQLQAVADACLAVLLPRE